MIALARLALFRDASTEPYLPGSGFLWRHPPQPRELSGPSFPRSLVTEAARLQDVYWAGALQMPGVVIASADRDEYWYSLRVTGGEIGRVRIASWHESKLASRANVALLVGEGPPPALLLAHRVTRPPGR